MNRKAAGAVVRDRKVLLLSVLLVLLVVSLYLQFGEKPGTPASIGNSSSGSKSKGENIGEDPLLLMAELRAQRPEYEKEMRNLFSFYSPPPPVPVLPTEVEEEEPSSPVCGDALCEEGENSRTCPSDCGPPPPPEIALRYIGYLQEKDGAVVFLTDGRDIFMGRVNDVIANRYRIIRITNEDVELGFLNINQSRTIPFQGNNRS